VSNYRSREMREMREALKAFTDAYVACPGTPHLRGGRRPRRGVAAAFCGR
jgi:hypothetical protein